MFRRIRETIEKALAAREAARPLSREELDQILAAMRRELIELRARIPRLEKTLARLDAETHEQLRRAEHARSQARDARDAGREEEARRALDATARALNQAEALKRQLLEAREELAGLRAEAAEKMERLKEAKRDRAVLLARSRRARTARRLEQALHGPESGIERFERAEEDLEEAEDLAAAAREVDEALGGSAIPAEAEYDLRRLEAAEEMDAIERRLLELKKQVEEEGQ